MTDEERRAREREHRRQRYLISRYGPRDIFGEPIITAGDLRMGRREYGDPWVTERLEQMRRDYLTAKNTPKSDVSHHYETGGDDTPDSHHRRRDIFIPLRPCFG